MLDSVSPEGLEVGGACVGPGGFDSGVPPPSSSPPQPSM